MLDRLKKYATDGNLVIIVGAGISKDSPSNVPSWWEYNKMLLKIMGECGAETIGMEGNLLDTDNLDQYIPVTTVSELLLDRFAGESYYSLVRLLEASIPNTNHLMLAKLAQDKSLRACITTNFDTLIEHAFRDCDVPIIVCDSPTDFLRNLSDKDTSFPLLKIHGSVTDCNYAIDTVRQKVKGLESSKRAHLENLFRNNHVLFLGFSGDDYLIDSDYIPISVCKNGVTWVSYPGSRLNHVIKKFSEKEDFEVVFMTLPDFYKEMKWNLDLKGVAILKDYCKMPVDREQMVKAEKLIWEYYLKHDLRWGCVGTCLGLLSNQNSPLAEEVYLRIKQNIAPDGLIKRLDINMLPAITAAVQYDLEKENYKEAESICKAEIQIMELNQISLPLWAKTHQHIRGFCFNYSTVWQNAARIMVANNDYAIALEYYTRSLRMAYKGHSFQALSSALLGIALCNDRLNPDKKEIIDYLIVLYELHGARKLAIEGGHVDAQIFSDSHLVYRYAIIEDYNNARRYYNEIIELSKLATQRDAVSTIIRELTSVVLSFSDITDNNLEIRGLLPKKRSADSWRPFTSYPVLDYEAGKRTKQIYDEKGLDEAYSYIYSVCEPVIMIISTSQDLDYDKETASLLDCFIGLAMEAAIKLDKESKVELYVLLRSCSDYLLEYNLRVFDYYSLITSLSSVAYLYAMTAISDEEYQIADFAAKSCRTMYPDGCFDYNYVFAVAALYFSSYKRKNYIDANIYAVEYLELPSELSDNTIPGLRDYLSDTIEKMGNK